MHALLLSVSIMCLVILLLMFVLKRLKQPYMVAYIVTGILLGPQVLGVFSQKEQVAELGELGILLLMFFLGIELDIPDNRSLLRKPLIAQGCKLLLSLACSFVLGNITGWEVSYILLLALLFTFNSTAVVSEFLKKNNDLYGITGRTVLNMLLLQDVMVAPTFTLLQFFGKAEVTLAPLAMALAGCVLIFLLLRSIRNRNLYQLPIVNELGKDHELQVFAAILICLGFALLASSAHLTPAIGSFVAGVFIGRTKAFHWLENTLRPFQIFFMAFFFVSVGLGLDMVYILDNYQWLLAATITVMLINSVLSTLIFKWLSFPWKDSIYAGALLSQTGEFGLLACSVAYEFGVIDGLFYKAALAITGLTLLLSTIWISFLRKVVYKLKTRIRF